MRDELNLEELFSGETADVTSEAVSVSGAKRISFIFTRASHTSGNTVFTVEGSYDGDTWIALNILIDNAANSNAETLARLASKTLSTATSAIVALDCQNFCFPLLRVKADVTTDGANSAYIMYEV